MIQTAPPAEVFPEYPASWYLFGESRELRQGPVSRRILGRLLVAFRTESGRLVVMDGECAHLGADLGFGDVVGETIRCPFHHWQYGCDGACVAVPGQGPGQGRPPAFARQRTYPTEERHGYLFFFNGREPLFPLPFFLNDQGLGEDPTGYVASKVFRYVADCTWYMNSAHAFDRQPNIDRLGLPARDMKCIRRGSYKTMRAYFNDVIAGSYVTERVSAVIVGNG